MGYTNRETERKQRNKKGKISLFNNIGKGCILNKSKKLVIEAAKNSYKDSFITEGYFLYFGNLRVLTLNLQWW